MNVRHRLTIAAICPVDGSRDIYKVTVGTSEMINVETILAEVALATKKPLYQEHLTVLLAAALGARVTTKGIHSGVKTVCVADQRIPA
jgi:hypothetical protein